MNLVSVTEAAKALKISRQWLWVLIKMGKISAFKVGSQYVLNNEDVLQFKASSNLLNEQAPRN
jgi:excisionase family DNA binding protein